MSSPTFTRAERRKAKLRLGLVGPSGSGKSVTALRIASALGKRIAAIDSESGSLSLYAPDGTSNDSGFCPQGFDTLDLKTFAPQSYVAAIHMAEKAGYDVIIIDSLSHAWFGTGGSLDQVDAATSRSGGNKWAAWREVTPHHNDLINAMIQSKCHIIATMRTKTEYVVEQDERGKQKPKKIGTAPIQRDGMEYEFTLVGDMDHDHNLIITKTRCPLFDRAVIKEPGPEVGEKLLAWLELGTPATSSQQPTGFKPAEPSKFATPTDPKTAPPAPQAPPRSTINAQEWEKLKETLHHHGIGLAWFLERCGADSPRDITLAQFDDVHSRITHFQALHTADKAIEDSVPIVDDGQSDADETDRSLIGAHAQE